MKLRALLVLASLSPLLAQEDSFTSSFLSGNGYGDHRPVNLIVPSKKKHTKKPSTALKTTTAPSKYKEPTRKCRGECINGLFALLCDHVDLDAYCPGEATCCTTEPKGEQTTTRRPPTTPGPTTPWPTSKYNEHKCRGDCTGLRCDHVDEDAYCPGEEKCCVAGTKRPPTTPKPAPLPRCPGSCMLKLMMAFCERPAVIVPHTQCEEYSGSMCCDNSRKTRTRTGQ